MKVQGGVNIQGQSIRESMKIPGQVWNYQVKYESTRPKYQSTYESTQVKCESAGPKYQNKCETTRNNVKVPRKLCKHQANCYQSTIKTSSSYIIMLDSSYTAHNIQEMPRAVDSMWGIWNTHQLVGNVSMVLTCHTLSNGRLHQSGQGRQHIDWWVNLQDTERPQSEWNMYRPLALQTVNQFTHRTLHVASSLQILSHCLSHGFISPSSFPVLRPLYSLLYCHALYLSVVKLSVNIDLALSDVTSQVGNGVSYVWNTPMAAT